MTIANRAISDGELLRLRRWNTPDLQRLGADHRFGLGLVTNLEETKDFMPQMGTMAGVGGNTGDRARQCEHKQPNAWTVIAAMWLAYLGQIVVVQDL